MIRFILIHAMTISHHIGRDNREEKITEEITAHIRRTIKEKENIPDNHQNKETKAIVKSNPRNFMTDTK
jgi:hypothetical protein